MPSYVGFGGVSRAQASNGLTLTHPAVSVGQLTILQLCYRATGATHFEAFDPNVTAPSAVWPLLFSDLASAVGANTASGGRQILYYHFATSNPEANLAINFPTTAQNLGILSAGMYVFNNVLNPGTATFAEAAKVSAAFVSGPISDEDITTTGNNRIAVNFIYTNLLATCATETPASETGGSWIFGRGVAGVTGSNVMGWLWQATMATPGTIGGGQVANTAVGINVRINRGFALAPCGAPAAILSKIPRMMHHYIMLRA